MQTTALTDFGITQISPPMAAALSGFSLKSVNRRIAEGQLPTTGRTKKLISVLALEALTGRPITAEAYLRALGAREAGDVRTSAG